MWPQSIRAFSKYLSPLNLSPLLENTMLKAEYQTRGSVPQDVIEAVELHLPAPAAGQVRIKVEAAPINPSDVLTLTGEYGMLPPLPAIGGNEGVGRIEEVGPEVSNLKVGQLVLLPVGCGTWVSHLNAPANKLIALPEGDPQQLAMLTVNPPTASLLLSQFVDLKPGDWVIQNAANSGVGSYLIQLAKLRGFKTINVVRRESAVAGVQAEGGDAVLVDGPDLAKRVRAATGGEQVRLGIDAVGGPSTDNLAASLCEGGVLVNYGMMSRQPCQVSPASFVFRDVSLRGFWLAKWFQNATPAEQMKVFGELIQLIASGKLRTHVAATYDVSQIKQAVAAAASGERDGKVLIVPK
jgi:NADPH:quinone reductase-like Zn-dependent oxidoreductase